jgi:uncharacterized membrane protein YraQ (UPF0718 family)
MNSCCHDEMEEHNHKHPSFDYILWGSLALVLPAYLLHFLFADRLPNIYLQNFSTSVSSLLNQMWWGVVVGIFFVGLLDKVPREFVISVFGRKRGLIGILRATLAGLTLDLCSHGILMVAMKIYERGASLGQTMAFLIASPWNSLSITLILWSLIGFWWTLTFLLLSAVIAIISGLVFERLVDKNILPANPNSIDLPADFRFFKEAKRQIKAAKFNFNFAKGLLSGGFHGSKMVLRWLFLGVVLASLMRTFIPAENFHNIFGPTALGLFFTILASTVIEVCSEGSAPIAADIMNIAGAPGNAFAFLMIGVSTDYTEIMALKSTTKSWKIALFLPLVTLPQVVAVGYILNHFTK